MADFRREALIKTLKEDYGITSDWQLFEALRTMTQLDISQFVLRPNEEGETRNGLHLRGAAKTARARAPAGQT